MYWNHRVVKTTESGEEVFGIHEAFYNDSGKIYAYTKEPVAVVGENKDDLRTTLNWMLAALDKPVLVDGDVEFAKPDWDQ